MRAAAALTAAALLLSVGPCLASTGAGERLFMRRCGGCHSLGANRFGPALGDVYGRRAATAPGFRYSAALRARGFIWDAASLDSWLMGPRRLVPGSAMAATVANADERAAIIAFLRSRQSGR
ncbi:MAG: c-type cytochrome [Brevundimonas sp.]